MFSRRGIWSSSFTISRTLNCENECSLWRNVVKRYKRDDCRRAIADIPPKPQDEICTKPCRQSKKPPGILHRIKLRMIEGGTNFGTPFRRLRCKEDCKPTKEGYKSPKEEKPKALSPPEKEKPKMPAPLPGMQVAILGADTAIGQYIAFLLKQCPVIKRLRLYEASDKKGCHRRLCQVAEDLQNIDTNCHVQAFTCACYELERCLQNSDIVLILESSYVNADVPYDKRFHCQAPIIKCYTDVIANECPKAFIIVCATPIECMVPLIAMTLNETGWYNPCKVLGSLAVPEMRATTLAARALGLEPQYTRVPCVGGTEGEALVPLFSRAVEYFDFAQNNSMLMTQAVRNAPQSVLRQDEGCCTRAADLSEAHAVAGLVTNVAHALACNDVPRVTGFVETDPSQVISPARFIANQVCLSGTGIIHNLGLPKMNDMETEQMNLTLTKLNETMTMVEDWHYKFCCASGRLDASRKQFFVPRSYSRFDDCAYDTV